MKILLSEEQSGRSYINNFKRKKFSTGPGNEPGSLTLRASAITTMPPRRSTWPCRNIFSYWIPPYLPKALVPSIRDGGEHI